MNTCQICEAKNKLENQDIRFFLLTPNIFVWFYIYITKYKKTHHYSEFLTGDVHTSLSRTQLCQPIKSLTSGFGMGPGVTSSLQPPDLEGIVPSKLNNTFNIRHFQFSYLMIKSSTYQYQSTTSITTLPSLTYQPHSL